MGNCGGGLSEEDKRARELDAQLRREANEDMNKIKLLLLGAGESGKSTIFKQMKILYSATHGWSEKEKKPFINTIHSNIIVDLKIVAENALETGEPKSADAIKELLTWDKRRTLAADELSVVSDIWDDELVASIWENRAHLQVQDSLEYYMDNIKRICEDGYIPTVDDILRSRVRTTGVVHEEFQIDDKKFEMYDVGGQRNERKKWIHSFENVTAVMFIAAVSEYNQVLFEDQSTSRQDEAMELFYNTLRIEYFRQTPFILFLNKVDLLRKKLPKIPFKVTSGDVTRNEDYNGPECEMDREKAYKTDGSDPEFEACYDGASEYLKMKYLDKQNSSGRSTNANIYPHLTNSTDSDNVRKIMQACKDVILQRELRNVGLIE